MIEKTKLSPPELARRWGMKPDTVRALITSGQLDATDFSLRPGVGKPRWKIDIADVIAFELRRKAKPPPKATRRRRKPIANVIEFF